MRLSWRAHISNKCKAASRSFAVIRRCFNLTWGLSSDKLLLLYKTIILPKITYCCGAWAAAVNSKWCVSMLRSAQRPSALGISRAFRSTSINASLVLANLLPLDLQIKQTVALKLLAGSKLPLSSVQLCSNLIDRAQAFHPHTHTLTFIHTRTQSPESGGSSNIQVAD